MGWNKFECEYCYDRWYNDYTNADIWVDQLRSGWGYGIKGLSVCLYCKEELTLLSGYYNWEEEFYIETLPRALCNNIFHFISNILHRTFFFLLLGRI